MGYHSRNNGLFCYSEDKKYNQSTLIRPYVFVFLFCEGTRPIQTVALYSWDRPRSDVQKGSKVNFGFLRVGYYTNAERWSYVLFPVRKVRSKPVWDCTTNTKSHVWGKREGFHSYVSRAAEKPESKKMEILLLSRELIRSWSMPQQRTQTVSVLCPAW